MDEASFAEASEDDESGMEKIYIFAVRSKHKDYDGIYKYLL